MTEYDAETETPGYALDRARKALEDSIDKILKSMGVDAEYRLEYPPPGIDADFALPCFPFSKQLKKAPAVIAGEIAKALLSCGNNGISAEVAGGYLNITLNREELFREIFKDFTRYGDDYGNSSRGDGKCIAIDYSSPNIAKPFSVGNIRSTIIGQAIYNLFKCQGYTMAGVNHLGDWGTQFGKLIYAYQQWGDREKVEKNPIRELLALYVRFHRECGKSEEEDQESVQDDNREDKSSSSLEEEARRRFKLLEEGDRDITEIWRWFVDVSLEDFNRIYKRLNVSFDFIQGESFYIDKVDEVIRMVKEKGLGSTDEDGAFLVKLDQWGIDTPLLLQKSDGATLYATRELAELIYRTRTFNPVMLLYVVGSEQKLHFRQCFKVLELLGFKTQCHHVEFGMVSLKEGKMSTRAGRVIFFEDLMEEARQRVMSILNEKRPDLSDEEKGEIAEVVGIGALKFNDLSQNRIKNIVFDWDKMLSFDGDTAPYLQYSYARVRSILRKAQTEPALNPALIKEPQEISLMIQLGKFPMTVSEAADKFAPQLIAQYLLETSRIFTSFYQNHSVLKADNPGITASRLELIALYAAVIRKGLQLLGIDVLERM